jgi:hypothetical protein
VFVFLSFALLSKNVGNTKYKCYLISIVENFVYEISVITGFRDLTQFCFQGINFYF